VTKDERSHHPPKTVSLCPAKSIVLTPRVCCRVAEVKAALERVWVAKAGLAARAETKRLRGKDCTGTLALEAALRLVPNVRDAIRSGDWSDRGRRSVSKETTKVWGNL
jgi:hypothetical protein